MRRIFVTILRRDLRLAARRRSDALLPLAFFAIAASLFPLGIGPEPETLRIVAPGVVWVCALLAAMLSVSQLYAGDLADGSLDQMLLAGGSAAAISTTSSAATSAATSAAASSANWSSTSSPCSASSTTSPSSTTASALAVAIAKPLAHWILTGLPLTVVTPLLGVLFGVQPIAIAALTASLLLGTPILSLLGSLGAALTLGVRGGSVLMILLVLPLCVPTLIFGSGAVVAIDSGLSARGHFSLLGALLILTLLLAPLATAAALRIATE